MNNIRTYGKPPFRTAVIHGGPGAPGGMAPVAREISQWCGVLEPLQTADSVDGQIEELHDVLIQQSTIPVVLAGSSWGAWLSFLTAAKYPTLVNKLIMIGSGPFESKYVANLMDIRLNRLNEAELREAEELLKNFDDPNICPDDECFERLGELMLKTESYDPIEYENEVIACQSDIFNKVWTEANRMRSTGELLEIARKIECPVIAVHGDYDPHLAEGVEKPLSNIIKDFKFILLEKCGHYPWYERHARDKFYEIIKNELGV